MKPWGVRHHAINVYGVVEINLHAFLIEVNNELHSPATSSLGEGTPTNWIGDLMGPRTHTNVVEKKIFHPLSGTKSWLSGHSVDSIIPAHCGVTVGHLIIRAVGGWRSA
jgi:hypothetical protein